MSGRANEGLPRLTLRDPREEIAELLAQVRRTVARDPDASAAVFSSLVAEGRRFADTPLGRKWEGRLESSALLRRASVLWDITTLWLVAERPEDTPASAYLDALFLAADSSEGESWLYEAQENGERDDVL